MVCALIGINMVCVIYDITYTMSGLYTQHEISTEARLYANNVSSFDISFADNGLFQTLNCICHFVPGALTRAWSMRSFINLYFDMYFSLFFLYSLFRKGFVDHLESVHKNEASYHCSPCNASFHTAVQLHSHENTSSLHKRVGSYLLFYIT